ncbi:MAG: hypothetical protein A3F17_00295 [Gammaproteobacteria bacterium RIFCSPHIGHO2_12_FULL_41_15]|nr:MAG: hypothetical protein A3F17_00295 [Gammaproteobacteria bacterium RIFCSPHIGHO2_12_FULL_41_15]
MSNESFSLSNKFLCLGNCERFFGIPSIFFVMMKNFGSSGMPVVLKLAVMRIAMMGYHFCKITTISKEPKF